MAPKIDTEIPIGNVPPACFAHVYACTKIVTSLAEHANNQNGAIDEIKEDIKTIHSRFDKGLLALLGILAAAVVQLVLFIFAIFKTGLFSG